MSGPLRTAEATEMAGRLAGKVCVITGTGGNIIDLVVDGGMKVW